MHRNRFLSVGFVSATLCVLSIGGAALAQAPSGQQSQPSSRPGAQGTGLPQNSQQASPVKVDDKKFLKDAALDGMTEVELGKLAAQKGSSDSVKQFGQKMVDDHTKANDALKQVAAKEGIAIPDSLDSKRQSRVDKLAKLSGAAFDKAYMKQQLKDHEADVTDFQNEAQNGSDPNIQQFASSTLPTLQQHLELAKTVEKDAKHEGK